jgi:hypothetical protein
MVYTFFHKLVRGGVHVKKLIVILIIAIVPIMAFAQFQVGGTALYLNDITQISHSSVNASDFLFGLETRAKLWVFQADATALYMPDSTEPGILGLADAGLSLNLWFIRVGALVGVNAIYDKTGLYAGSDLTIPYNVKATVDINLGGLSLGVEGVYFLGSLSDIKNLGKIIKDNPPFVGVNLLLKLF